MSDEERDWLRRPFTMEKVEIVVELCKGDKAPTPDGFNLIFFQKYWNTVKKDV